jgi:hypothetical protein
MAITYDSIATNTTTTTTSSFSFSSIPSSYTDLRLVIYHTVSSNQGGVYLRFNSDTGTNYSSSYLQANNTTLTGSYTSGSTGLYVFGTNPADSTNPALWTYDIFEYSDNKYKTVLADVSSARNATNSYLFKSVAMWNSTAAINAIDIIAANFSFGAGTVATLYGILRA